ncbi:hypothetical protein [Clostridium tarantellae]|uniref:Serine protease n=1 Tax=Clostridium tarantellae TaxID=39493 RepID=A0A6I1MGD9_9CLOT|nr:hypothetical protein [Clostridium tarantellae]MPQ42435.1 hypothetical protein [Clostridium tarantellae]
MSYLLENSIIDVINNYYNLFSNKKNVIGIALGYKTTKNINSNMPSLRILVSKKTPLNQLYNHDIIPKDFFGIKTDVVETGTLKMQLSPYLTNKFFTFKLSRRKRPLTPGYSIGAVGGKGVGTLGCIVYTREKGKPCILSNNHVIANLNQLRKGTEILQPPRNFLGNSSPNLAGKLFKSTVLLADSNSNNNYKFDFGNFIDAAIAEIFPNIKFSNLIPKIGQVKGYIYKPELNTKIQKVGAATGYTKGTITDINATVRLELQKGRYYSFKDQIISTPMCKSGDSGSLAVTFSSNEAVGLYCGGNKEASIFNPISRVLNSLDVFFQ